MFLSLPRVGHILNRIPVVHYLLGCIALALTALLIARAPLQLAVAILVAAVIVSAVLIHPVNGLYVLALTIPFGSIYPFSLGSFVLDASDLMVGLIIFSWILHLATDRREHLAGGWWLVALVLFLFTLLVGLLPAVNLNEAIKELVKWGEFAAVMVFIINDAPPDRLDGIAAALLLAGTAEAILGIVQFTASSGPETFAFLGGYTRAFGTFGQPNPFAGYLGLLIPLAYGIVLFRWPYHTIKGPSKPAAWLWWLALFSAAVMLVALLMSGSRGALAGLMAGIAIVILVAGMKYWLVILVIIVLGLLFSRELLALVPQAYLSRLADVFTMPFVTNLETLEITDANFSLIERAAHWQAAWRMFSLHPWLGVGLGQYAVVYPLVALPRWSNPLGHAHNILLNTLAEGGLVGLTCYLLFQITLVVQAISTALKKQRFRWLGLAATGTWGALFTHNLVDNLYVHHLQLVVAIIFSLVILVHRGSTRADKVNI